MNKFLLLCLIIYSLGFGTLNGQVEFSGFFDIIHQHSLNTSKNSNVEFGQFEFGLAKSISPKLNFEGAVAFNTETSNFELGSAFIEYSIPTSQSLGFMNNVFENLAIMAGQFDVPFGIDYKCIASPDRKMISAPLASTNGIACLSSLGVELHGESENFNFNTYLINGINNDPAAGIRVGVMLISNIELGASYLSSLLQSNLNILGGDLQLEVSNHEFKGEVISSQGVYQGEVDPSSTFQRNTGYYIQYSNTFVGFWESNFRTGIRYGNWNNKINYLEESVNKISLLFGLQLLENAEIRTEFNIIDTEEHKTENLIYTQLVFTL